jgi:hypothetical protein
MGSAVRFGLGIVILLAGSAYAGLELTPQSEEYELEGVKLHQLVFNDGGHRVTYAPPRKWTYSGGGNRFVLRPASESNAEAVITVSNLSRPETFDAATIKRLSDDVLASIPPGSTNVSVVSQQLNPILIGGKPTFQIVISYNSYGQAYTRSVMFLDRQNDQVRFQLTASQNVFREAQKAFERSHYSWQNL